MHETALLHELVHGNRLDPETQIEFEADWIRLLDHPKPKWLDLMAAKAVTSAEQSDPIGIMQWTGKILRYSAGSPGEDVHESVRVAKFLLGHVNLCAGQHREAVRLLEPAASRQSRFSPTAHNNLGVAWAHLRHPEAALRTLETALTQDPTFLPARISLRNLALTLIEEQAPTLPGRLSWMEIARQEETRLRQAPLAQVHALLNPRRPFPNYTLWHVFEVGRYLPGIGSELAANPLGQRSAALILQEANQALSDADYERARTLASVAPQFDPGIQPTANSLAAAAAAKHEETRLLNSAQRLIQRLGTFVRVLRGITLDNLEGARVSQILVPSLVPQESLDRLYHERIEELVLESLETEPTDDDRDSRLYTMAHQLGQSESAEAYRTAAVHSLAHRVRSVFWKAVVNGDLDAARVALNRAALIFGSDDALMSEKVVFQSLEQASDMRGMGSEDIAPNEE
jgi:tetratricopeptide (TPR) repeat protein